MNSTPKIRAFLWSAAIPLPPSRSSLAIIVDVRPRRNSGLNVAAVVGVLEVREGVKATIPAVTGMGLKPLTIR